MDTAKSPVVGRKKDPEGTRARLLECAFHEMHEHGYAGASLDRILADSGVTKGALYHHFGSKAELAYAVIDERVREFAVDHWLDSVTESDDPITAIRETLSEIMTDSSEDEMRCGCPLTNLTQELSATDDTFRRRLESVREMWRDGTAEALERGQAAGTVREDLEAQSAATLIVATMQGLASNLKSTRDPERIGAAGMVFLELLENFRPRA